MEKVNNNWSNKTEKETINSNNNESIVKISHDTDVKKAINYVENLFKIKKKNTIIICGLSLAISKVILIAEIVKTHIKDLHQINNIDCLMSHDKFDNSIEKRIPKLEIILTTVEPKYKGMGYQKPMSEEQFKNLEKLKSLNKNKENEDFLENEEEEGLDGEDYIYENKYNNFDLFKEKENPNEVNIYLK